MGAYYPEVIHGLRRKIEKTKIKADQARVDGTCSKKPFEKAHYVCRAHETRPQTSSDKSCFSSMVRCAGASIKRALRVPDLIKQFIASRISVLRNPRLTFFYS